MTPTHPPVPARVALFLPTFEGGGAERAFINLARGFRDLGVRTDFVVANADGPYRDEVPEGVSLVDLQARRFVLSLPALVRYLRQTRPDRLYSALEEANVFALLARRLAGGPTLVFPSIRNTLSQEKGNEPLRSLVIRRLARRLYPGADGIVAVSKGAAEDAAATLGLAAERISVISNPTVTPDLGALAAAPLDDPWFGDGEPPVVLGCGRLVPQKDFSTLLAAFAILRARRSARLVILGEGPLRDDLGRQAEALGVAGDVSFPGFDANPFRYMARAGVFALSSKHEGSPNVLVQALACGVPVVATDCPSGPSEILPGVPHGRLVPVGDPAALAAAMDALLGAGGPRPAPWIAPGFDYRASAAAFLALKGRVISG